MRIGMALGVRWGTRGGGNGKAPDSEPVFAKATSASSGMSGGRISVQELIFAAPCSWSVKYYNNSTQAQIGTTKTGSFTTGFATVASVVVADGVEVRAAYTCTTTEPGFINVTQETNLWIKTMLDGSGTQGPYVPDNPVG